MTTMLTAEDLWLDVDPEWSVAQRIAAMPREQRLDWLMALPKDMLEDVYRGEWWYTARPKQLIGDGDWTICMLLAGRGFGKMVHIDTPIPVPTGWTRLGDLKVRDQVFDEAGNHCQITAIFEGTPEVAYRVHFSDHTHIDACSEHQWVTWTHAERKAFLRSPYEDARQFPEDWPTWRLSRMLGRQLSREVVEKALELKSRGWTAYSAGHALGISYNSLVPHFKAGRYIPREPVIHDDAPGPQIRTTQELFETQVFGKRGDRNHCIPTTGPLQLPEADLPLDPYVLGAWLGNGHKAGPTFTYHEDDQSHFEAQVVRAGFEIGNRSDSQTVGVLGMMPALRAAGVLNNKHVPRAYLRGSEHQRRALLAGLLDTDGYAQENGQIEFSNTTRDLIDSVAELARSLGQKPVISPGKPGTLNGVPKKIYWRVTWQPTTQPFWLLRKAAVVEKNLGGAQALRNHHRMITSIERIEPVPMRCLTVDSPNSMFLCGEGMIPTHNTRSVCEWLADQVTKYPRDVNGHPTEWAMIGETLSDTRSILLDGPSGLISVLRRREILHKRINWPKPMVTLETGQVIHGLGADDTDVGRGLNLAGAVLDEIAKWQNAKELWTEGLFPSLRTKVPGDHKPRVVAATTPKPTPLVLDWAKRTDGSVKVIRGSTFENSANLAREALAEFHRMYDGTRAGEQELHAKLLIDAEGALWSNAGIEADRVRVKPELVRVVVAMDPAVTVTADSDETGLVAVGRDAGGDDYVLADASGKFVGGDAARRAWLLWRDLEADELGYEPNNGGDWIRKTLEDTWYAMQLELDADGEPMLPAGAPPIKAVHAKVGKRLRADPQAARYERHKVHHVGMFPQLEEQQTTWEPGSSGDSPDRLDALVHALALLGPERGRDMIVQEIPEDAAPMVRGGSTGRGELELIISRQGSAA